MAKRRPNGTGTMTRKKNGYECQIFVGWRGNKRLVKSFSGRTQKEVIARRDAYLKEHSKNQLTTDLTFEEAAIAWYDHHVSNLKESTQQSYRYPLRLLCQSLLGQKYVSQITAVDIENLLLSLQKANRSESYIQKCRGMAHQIMAYCQKLRIISDNVVVSADTVHSVVPTKERDTFTDEEIQLIMEHANINDRMHNSVVTLINSGLRLSEFIALLKEHIAPDGSSITVEQAVVRKKGGICVSTPKNKYAYRTVPIPEVARPFLCALRETQGKYIWEGGIPGQPCNPSHFERQFKKALAAIPGVRTLTPYSCRHTYISKLEQNHVSLEVIGKLVGHNNQKTTRGYIHIHDPRMIAATQTLNR